MSYFNKPTPEAQCRGPPPQRSFLPFPAYPPPMFAIYPPFFGGPPPTAPRFQSFPCESQGATPAAKLRKYPWIEHSSVDGGRYFFNVLTKETRSEIEEVTSPVPDVNIPITGTSWAVFRTPDANIYFHNYATATSTWECPTELQYRPDVEQIISTLCPKTTNVKTEPEQKESDPTNSTPQQNSSSPISSTIVVGTCWSVVWTGDGKVFFYNASTNSSVWEKPPDLYDRPDVDVLTSNCAVVDVKSEPELVVLDSPKKNRAAEVEEPSQKKKRYERDAHAQASTTTTVNKSPRPPPPPRYHEDPAVQAEIKAQKHRAQIPLETRLRQFREMLEEKAIDYHSTFERELQKIVFEKRYLLLTAAERRAAFESFANEKKRKDRDDVTKKIDENKHKFEDLMMEAHVGSGSSFSSFARRYGKDYRFNSIDTMRDREYLFKEYTDKLYQKERHERHAMRYKASDEFENLLQEIHEMVHFDDKTKWAEVQKMIKDEPRYYNKYLHRVKREAIFEKFMKNLGNGN